MPVKSRCNFAEPMGNKDDLILGVDVGGSHITVGLVDLNTKKILESSYFRADINSHASAEDLLHAWGYVIKSAFATVDTPCKRIGISMPGPFDYENGISYIKGNKKYDSLYGLNVKELLAQELNTDPEHIRMLNDGACFLKGEVLGLPGNYNNAIGLTLGTGLGTAVYHDGIAADAELWNSPFLDGMAEEYISTRWFVKRYFELTDIHIRNVKELYDISESSGLAKSVFREFANNLGLFVYQFAMRENAEIVILGGNISKASSRFLTSLRNYLAKQGLNIPVQVTKIGEAANLLGAASIWMEEVLS